MCVGAESDCGVEAGDAPNHFVGKDIFHGRIEAGLHSTFYSIVGFGAINFYSPYTYYLLIRTPVVRTSEHVNLDDVYKFYSWPETGHQLCRGLDMSTFPR